MFRRTFVPIIGKSKKTIDMVTTNTLAKMEEKRKRIILALVLSSYLVVGIDGSLVITAIAQIASELHMDSMAMSWVQNAYVLAFGGFLLAGGRLGDIHGRKHTFCASIILFGIGSLGAGLSQTAWMMIPSRFVQGVGSAAMAPAALGLIVDYFQGRERVKVVAWYGSISGLGLCVGLVLGGAITSYASWRWGFLVNIPIMLLMFVYAHRWLYEGTKTDGRLDVSGTVLSAMGVFALVYAIDGASNSFPWMVAALACLLAFIKTEQRAKFSIVPASLFRSRNRCNGYLSRLMLIGALMGYNFAVWPLRLHPLANGLRFPADDAHHLLWRFGRATFGRAVWQCTGIARRACTTCHRLRMVGRCEEQWSLPSFRMSADGVRWFGAGTCYESAHQSWHRGCGKARYCHCIGFCECDAPSRRCSWLVAYGIYLRGNHRQPGSFPS